MGKTKKAYEEYLNEIYLGDKAWDAGGYMCDHRSPGQFHSCIRLLNRGKYGACLRKYDPIAFNVGFTEWSGK